MDTFKTICVSLVLILFMGGGCAPLPDVSKITDHAQTERPPKIMTAKGMLSDEKSRELIKRLQGAVYQTDLVQRHNAVMEAVDGSPLIGGNKVTLLTDGQSTYAAIIKAIQCATETINLETYKIENDEIGRAFADLLVRKQQEGVQVNLIYDGIGSLPTPTSFFDRMRETGVQVVEVNPLSDLQVGAVNPLHADHRKLLVVDGKVVITGGINISAVYTSTPFQSGRPKKPSEVPWRDTDVQIEGPAAAAFQQLFLDMWQKQKGPPLQRECYFPKLESKGHALVRAIANNPGESNRITYISYVSALMFAEHAIHLTNAYFIPDDKILDALSQAARRGVDVRIIVPSITDSSLAYYAMRYNYAELLQAGVKLYERKKALLHAKTAVIDGVWSTVGSTNMDFLSLSSNYELNAVVLSPKFGADMEAMFAKDVAESDEITWEKWQQRSILERTKELFAHMMSHVL
ncbi:cardiolipin synthase [Geomonas sp.]|uniref:cardiolipin synthase n=1 Tax=Geomonas sp. TaxID=2651584 RepID=UPI002B491256|nr:cardiolipin synthase [Geomonas sp.]HJV33768.1 cardiolipin synthase [Geomonas sp.]